MVKHASSIHIDRIQILSLLGRGVGSFGYLHYSNIKLFKGVGFAVKKQLCAHLYGQMKDDDDTTGEGACYQRQQRERGEGVSAGEAPA